MLHPLSSTGATLKNLKSHVNIVLVFGLNLTLWLKVHALLLIMLNSQLDED